jgi:translocation and assembly module TamA
MGRSGLWLWAALCVAAPSSGAASAQSARVSLEIKGITGELRDNVQSLVSLSTAAKSGDTVSTLRIRSLFARAPGQIEDALQPFGYYHPTITSDLATGKRWVARFTIDPGPATMIGRVAVRLTGLGRQDSVIQQAVAAIPLAPGDTLIHARYTAGKTAIAQAALDRGYLDAVFDTAQVRVDRERQTADIVLDLATGPQYLFGDVRLEQDAVDPLILQGYINIVTGEPFDMRKLRDIQSRLSGTSYFAQVEVLALRDSAQGLSIPVSIVLTTRAAQHFNIGVGYGTNTNLRVTLNADFRRLNSRGHYANLNLRVSSIEKSMSARYSIPARYPLTTLLEFFTGLALLDPVSYRTDKFVLGTDLSRTRGKWRETLSLSYSHEDYVVGTVDTGTSNLVIASANFTRVVADNNIFATKGTRVGLLARGSVEGLLADETFLELTVPAKAIVSFLGDGRVITRAELGAILTSKLSSLPPTARFFTGGDRSVRGYEYLALGPTDAAGNVIGGDALIVVSAELNYFFYGDFGASAFYDAGNALLGFSDITLFQGAGVGVRWRSPIGPIGLDLAWALSLDGTPRRIHITLGPDF